MIKKTTLLLLFVPFFAFSQVGIGTTNPNQSSILDIVSTEAGILVPRMTEAQRTSISSPATGLMVYQTNNTTGFWYYNGSSWVNIATGSISGEFQSIGGIVQNTTNIGSDDFVFGSSTLSGSGTRFFFDKSKGAFRAGESSSTGWDDVNVGDYSIALGRRGIASGFESTSIAGGNATGTRSVAIGDGGDATNVSAIALGFGTASGEYAIALQGGTASGNYSFTAHGGTAAGNGSIVIGGNSTVDAVGGVAIGPSNIIDVTATSGIAIGKFNDILGVGSIAIGKGNISSGIDSFAANYESTASGNESVAFNRGTATAYYATAFQTSSATANKALAFQGATASGIESTAIGPFGTEASGETSVAFGEANTAYSKCEFVIGYGSASYTPNSTTTYNNADRLFVVANNTTNNALTMLKNGRMGLSRIPTTNILEVGGQASKNSAGDWVANSDSRLKKNIETFKEQEALNKLLQMRGVTYEWNDKQTGSQRPEGIQYGFIAQEIKEVFPENVELDNLGYYQTAYGTYDAMYVQAIKALNNKLESLEAENETLKNEIQKIYSLLNQGSSNEKELVIRD